MEITLNLKKHCIQTAIKRKYNQRISKYFKLNPTENTAIIESEISLLKKALEKLDFSHLRSAYTELQGGGDNNIILTVNADSKITISINDRIIHATYKDHKHL